MCLRNSSLGGKSSSDNVSSEFVFGGNSSSGGKSSSGNVSSEIVFGGEFVIGGECVFGQCIFAIRLRGGIRLRGRNRLRTICLWNSSLEFVFVFGLKCHTRTAATMQKKMALQKVIPEVPRQKFFKMGNCRKGCFEYGWRQGKLLQCQCLPVVILLVAYRFSCLSFHARAVW